MQCSFTRQRQNRKERNKSRLAPHTFSRWNAREVRIKNFPELKCHLVHLFLFKQGLDLYANRSGVK